MISFRKILMLGILVSPMCHAADTLSDCGHFHLQIANLTKSACILTSQKVVHGNLISSPPTSIMPNDSKVFDMEQTYYGPSVILSYQCGEENITFKSQQNYCYLHAGNITGEVLDPQPVVNKISYKSVTGSYYWEKPGNINWEIVAN